MSTFVVEVEESGIDLAQVHGLSGEPSAVLQHELRNRWTVEEENGDGPFSMGGLFGILCELAGRDEDAVIIITLDCAAELVEHWVERTRSLDAQLADIARDVRWCRDSDRTLSVARAIYLRLPGDTQLWFRGEEFVPFDRKRLVSMLRTEPNRPGT